jgi:hypothetical protein
MKYLSLLTLAGVLICVAGCASAPRAVVTTPLGPGPAQPSQPGGDGSVVLYTAPQPADVDINTLTWLENNDYGRNAFLVQQAHSDYTIYTSDGQLFKRVANSSGADGKAPAVVELPPSTYRIESEAIDCNATRVPVLLTVVVRPGQTTLANLDGTWTPEVAQGHPLLARLPCGRPIGYSANDNGLATNP